MKEIKLSLLCLVIILSLLPATTTMLVSEQSESKTLSPYDIERSKTLALFASVAACPKGCIELWACKVGRSQPLSDVSFFQNITIRAGVYIGYSQSLNKVIIAFRGSGNVETWMEQGHYTKSPYIYCLGCFIHSGFYTDYLFFESAIHAKVISLLNKYTSASVVVTGHNLGGGLAMVCGLQLKRIYPTIQLEIHTFGAPRIGDIQLARFMNNKIQNIYRVVRDRDILPHLPPDNAAFNFHHSAYEIFFDKDMTTYRTCGDSGQDRSCSNQYFPEYNVGENSWYFMNIEQPEC